MNYDTWVYGALRMNTYWKIITLLHCMYLLIENFVLHYYIEFNASHSQQTTFIFLIGIGIQDLFFDMWLQNGGWFKQNFCIELCTTYTSHLRERFFLINKYQNRYQLSVSDSLMFPKFQRVKSQNGVLVDGKAQCFT